MSKTFDSWNKLKKSLQKEVRDATEEAVEKSFQNLHENVDNFYAAPEGRYHRTGQLSDRKSTRLNSSHSQQSRMPSSA